ncbi:hypothetical protein Spla01_05909 [Streptomyces platensis]|uniref:Uncharacterized protein n=1 Tax=Streptomyces platensis TaxID=58346 RepID=A0ABX3XP19_STRPT|nr:hypothetical protein BG653_06510 [Streptomyces platensis]
MWGARVVRRPPPVGQPRPQPMTMARWSGSGERREAVKSAKGAFSPFGIALDSDNGVIYVSTYEGQLWRFSLSVLQSPELIEIVTDIP